MKTAEILKAFRERNELSQDVVAAYLGIKREMLSYYENNSREPSLDTLEKLTNLYGVDLTDLFEENPAQIKANIAFAFRASEFKKEDLDEIAKFRKVVKNYLKLIELEKNDR